MSVDAMGDNYDSNACDDSILDVTMLDAFDQVIAKGKGKKLRRNSIQMKRSPPA